MAWYLITLLVFRPYNSKHLMQKGVTKAFAKNINMGWKQKGTAGHMGLMDMAPHTDPQW